MDDILKKILVTKRNEVSQAKSQTSLDQLKKQISMAPEPRDFIEAIKAKHREQKPAIIAEIKKASPSKGVIRKDFHPETIAKIYAENGAACLSVLTDEHYFQGKPEYLSQARAACNLPVLRKDFIIDEYQIYQARAWGADAILLIAAALTIKDILRFETLAHQLGMAVLVEIHNQEEAECCKYVTTPLIGINNRNLHTFEVKLDTTLTLSKNLQGKIIVTESGIKSKEDIKFMQSNEINTFLIGEFFMRNNDIDIAFQEMYA